MEASPLQPDLWFKVGLRDRFFTRLPFRPMMKLCLLLIALAADAAKARIRAT